MTFFVACTLLVFVQQGAENRICSYRNLPVHGTVSGQTLFFFDGGKDTRAAVGAIPIDAPKSGMLAAFPLYLDGDAHCRHHISGNMLWHGYGPQNVARNRLGDDRGMQRALPALKERYERARLPDRTVFSFQPAFGIAIDFAPISDEACRVFFFHMKTKKIESWETEWALEKMKTEKGFKGSGWKAVADNRNPETIDSAFVEDFHVFKRKANYYFVTESGRLYLAPPPKEGEKSRTMKALWTDAKRPIVAVIEDADHDKVWLFAKDKNAGAKFDLYFEMKETIRTETFDPAKLRPINVEGRAKTFLEYLPLISADSKK